MRWILASIFLICQCTQAQVFPSFGHVTPEEWKITSCPFDADADVLIMVNEAVANYDDNYRLITEHYRKIKILTEKGIRWSEISIPYQSDNDFEYITEIEAITINNNGSGSINIQKVENKSVYTKRSNQYFSEKVFTFPSVKVGTILEYRFKSTKKHYGGLSDWYFQKSMPVIKSKFTLTVVPGYEFAYQVQKSNDLPIKIDRQEQNGTYVFEMNNIPGLRDEAYMDAEDDYLQKVKFQLSGQGSGFNKRSFTSTWELLAKEMLNAKNFGGQINDNLSGTDEFTKQTKAIQSAMDRMKAVYYFVRKNMNWNGINHRYSIEGVKSAWSKKNGSSGEINLILINLLKSVDLDVYPLLVSERYHGKVDKQYPFEDQFNTVYALVIIDGKKYYLNAVQKNTPPHIIPSEILNTTAFVVIRKSPYFIDVADETLQYKDFIAAEMKMLPGGEAEGKATILSSDYARVANLHIWKRDKDAFKRTYMAEGTGISKDSFEVQNEDNDSLALKQTFNFRMAANTNGEYYFIPLNLFTRYSVNPFVSDRRFTHINFGAKQIVSLNAIVEIPESFKVDVLPKPIKLVNQDNSLEFNRQVLQDEATRKIYIRLRIEHKKSLYTVQEYDAFQDFYKKMYGYLDEQIALKKK